MDTLHDVSVRNSLQPNCVYSYLKILTASYSAKAGELEKDNTVVPQKLLEGSSIPLGCEALSL
jgi:hypothetical protein